jgi:hypothetical protein
VMGGIVGWRKLSSMIESMDGTDVLVVAVG